jgi:hypothetical protein
MRRHLLLIVAGSLTVGLIHGCGSVTTRGSSDAAAGSSGGGVAGSIAGHVDGGAGGATGGAAGGVTGAGGGAAGTGGVIGAAGAGGRAGASGGTGLGGAGGGSGSGGTGSAGTGDAGAGGAGGTGACACANIYRPVCAVNGLTYGNTCEAACVGVAVALFGVCKDAGVDAGPPLETCATDNDCAFRPVAGCCGECLAITDPIPPTLACGIDCPVAQPSCVCIGQVCREPACAPAGVLCVACSNGYLTGPGGCRTCACKP